jgi:hypothetical protein
MKAGGIVLIILGVLLLGGSGFFGYFACHNSGVADRLGIDLQPDARFIVGMVKAKAERQTTISAAFGIPAALFIAGGALLWRRGKRAS